MNPALIFSTSLRILRTSRLSELRIIILLSRPKLTYSTKANGTSFPLSASRSRTKAAACIRSEPQTPFSGQFPDFKSDGTCAPSKQTNLEGTPLRLSLSEERNGSVLTGVSAASMGSFPFSSSAPRRLTAISGILALARASPSSRISLVAPANSRGNRSGRSVHIFTREASSSLRRLSAFNEHFLNISE